ncbi:hypothetical protein F4677DRAFT_444747 [Hypoxylon crocopeplum]|nr:hypothetical protein F4677DRAFT_444747 [Hypoxylon crocopeplum]
MLGRGISPIGIGTDICQISRIYKALSSSAGKKFVYRILTPQEVMRPRASRLFKRILGDHAHTIGPRDSNVMKAAEFMAGRFAAKEAVMKAYKIRRITFRDIEVTYERYLLSDLSREEQESSASSSSEEDHDQSSPPIAIIKGDGNYEDSYAQLSISHDGDYAVAMCLIHFDGLRSKES